MRECRMHVRGGLRGGSGCYCRRWFVSSSACVCVWCVCVCFFVFYFSCCLFFASPRVLPRCRRRVGGTHPPRDPSGRTDDRVSPSTPHRHLRGAWWWCGKKRTEKQKSCDTSRGKKSLFFFCEAASCCSPTHSLTQNCMPLKAEVSIARGSMPVRALAMSSSPGFTGAACAAHDEEEDVRR